jgi:hypothetical protein
MDMLFKYSDKEKNEVNPLKLNGNCIYQLL